MSKFLYDTKDYESDAVAEVDFNRAVRLPGGGSTCDVYKTRRQRREVFVKRLKEEFRASPLHLDALDKEFDIGVNLNHPALPHYHEFHRDYIVMDFIDGQTLADMIRDHDPWLAKEKNLLYVLRTLVDVVDYLHRHNVIHCDINPENIMITTNGRNLVLIDFDKCYSDALDDTPGDPVKYGLPSNRAGSVAIDFHGMALVARQLLPMSPRSCSRRIRRFIRACSSPDVYCEKLFTILDRRHRSVRPYAVAAFAATAIVLAALLLHDRYQTSTPDTRPESVSSTKSVNIAPDTAVVIPQATKPATAPHSDAEVNIAGSNIKQRATYLDRQIAPLFKELHTSLDRLAILIEDTTLTVPQLVKASRVHARKHDECFRKSFKILSTKYPGLSAEEAWKVMLATKAYADYMKRESKINAAYIREYKRRSNPTP